MAPIPGAELFSNQLLLTVSEGKAHAYAFNIDTRSGTCLIDFVVKGESLSDDEPRPAGFFAPVKQRSA